MYEGKIKYSFTHLPTTSSTFKIILNYILKSEIKALLIQEGEIY